MGQSSFKIASWNVNSLNVRLPHVLDWLKAHDPDVLAVQETKMTDEKFPVDVFESLGYHVAFSGQKTFNGVAVISKTPFEGEVITDFPGLDDPQRRIMGVSVNDIFVLDVYVPNGSSLDSDKYPYKLNWLSHLHEYLKRQLTRFPKLIVLGDFNIAPEDRDVHDPAVWEGGVLVSPKEREAFQGLLDLGLVDTFRLFDDQETIYSWWDYRQAAFRRNMGLRIDHILASKALANHCQSCVVDKAPRKLERPSDHAPVVAVFD